MTYTCVLLCGNRSFVLHPLQSAQLGFRRVRPNSRAPVRRWLAVAAMLGKESPTTVTASFDAFPESMALPLALIDADRKKKHPERPLHEQEPSGSEADYSCKAVGRPDTQTGSTNQALSAFEIWEQCLSEWIASNPEAAASAWAPKRAAQTHTPTVLPRTVARPKACGTRGRPNPTRPGPRQRAVGDDVALEGPLGLVAPPAGHTKQELMQLVQQVDACALCAIGGAHCSMCNLWRTLRAADQAIKK